MEPLRHSVSPAQQGSHRSSTCNELSTMQLEGRSAAASQGWAAPTQRAPQRQRLSTFCSCTKYF